MSIFFLIIVLCDITAGKLDSSIDTAMSGVKNTVVFTSLPILTLCFILTLLMGSK